MHVFQIMGSDKQGGAELFFCRLTASFAEQHLKQTVMVRKQSPYVNVLAQKTDCITAAFGGLFDFKSKKILKKCVEIHQPDLIMTWMNRATHLARSLNHSKKCPHIARLGGYYNLKYYQHSDHFIGNTRGICDYLIHSGLSTERVHHISNFANETPGHPLTRRTNRPLLVALGRLHPNKGFDTLIRAMSDVKEAELWIGGAGPLQSSLQKLVNDLNLTERIKLLGFIEKPEDVMATGDLFICPSRHEPLGNVILEAWAQNKAVLSTRNQGALELITPGENGYLTPIDDAKQLAHAISHLLSDSTLRQTIASQGHHCYQHRFSKKIITQQYINLFSDILSQRIKRNRS